MQRFILHIAAVALLCFGCEKQKIYDPAASLTVINAVVGSNPLVTNFSDGYVMPYYYKNARQIGYGSFSDGYQFGSYVGQQPLRLYQFPDTLVTSKPLLQLNLDLPAGSIKTLFLTGSVAQPETFVTTDNPPYHPDSDLSFGIRFVNLSSGAGPINVTLSTSIGTNEFASVSYKTASSFKNYVVSSAVSSYAFQVRDAITNNVIATHTLSGVNNGTGTNTSQNQYRYRNFTIALIGQPGGTGASAQRTILINNY